MEKIESKLFAKNQLTARQQYLFKGGHKTKPTISQTAKYDSTWYFFEDDNGNTTSDSTDDLDLGLLPATTHITSN
jgi:hypothetical protein